MEPVAIHAVGLTPAVLERVERGLADEPGDFSVSASEDVEEALDALATEPADCVVCAPDVREPGLLGFRALARDRGIDAPFVLFDGEHAAVLDRSCQDDGRGRREGRSSDADVTTDPASSLAACVETAIRSGAASEDATMGPLEIDRNLLQQFVDAMPDPVYVLDEERRFALVNEALLEYVGTNRESLIGTSVGDFLDRDRYDTSRSDLAAVRSGELSQASLEVALETDGGLERVTEANVRIQRDDDGTYRSSVGILRDVTERTERERELARYEAILETTPIGIFAVDEEGTMIWCNEAYPEPYHFTREELMGAPFSRVIEAGYYEESNLEDYLDRVRHLLSSESDDDRVQYTERIVDVDGDTRIYEVTMGLLPLEDGEFAGTVQAFREVTEERRYRRELERQNNRLENFASFVSHDLRNPLNVAQGYLDLIAEDADDERVEELAWSLDRMEELIGDLLTLAREGKEIGETEPVSLEASVRESWDAVDTPGASLAVDGDATIDADPDRLRSLFENLFRNAVEHGSTSPDSPPARQDAIEHGIDDGGAGASPDDPLLTVTVGVLDGSDSQDGQGGAPQGTTGFYVADDGVGLPRDDDGAVDQSLFEVGYTTNESGTGFGMGIVKEIVDAHDWTITAGVSEAGGALFEIRDVRPAHLPGDDADGE